MNCTTMMVLSFNGYLVPGLVQISRQLESLRHRQRVSNRVQEIRHSDVFQVQLNHKKESHV